MARALTPLFDRAEREGCASARIGDRIAGAVHLLTAVSAAQSPQALWGSFAARRDVLLKRHMQCGHSRLTASSPDTAARDPAAVPWGIYHWPARHRAAVICDYLALQVFMSADHLVESFHGRGFGAHVMLPIPGGVFEGATGVISVSGSASR